MENEIMVKRKIAECINLRVNVGNYQHIELTKYVEEEIEYSSATFNPFSAVNRKT